MRKENVRKNCVGCLDIFYCLATENYHYCKNCEVNGCRYVQNKCAECGDGSGVVRFVGQVARQCKLCCLGRKNYMEEKIKFASWKEQKQKEEKFRQELIADYKSVAKNKKIQKEMEIWDETISDMWRKNYEKS